MLQHMKKWKKKKANIVVVANSSYMNSSNTLFWLDDSMLAATDLEGMQLLSIAVGVLRQKETHPIKKGHSGHLQRIQWPVFF